MRRAPRELIEMAYLGPFSRGDPGGIHQALQPPGCSHGPLKGCSPTYRGRGQSSLAEFSLHSYQVRSGDAGGHGLMEIGFHPLSINSGKVS